MFLDQQWIKIASLNFVIISSTFPGRHSRFFNDYFIQSSAHLIANLRLLAYILLFPSGSSYQLLHFLLLVQKELFLKMISSLGICLQEIGQKNGQEIGQKHRTTNPRKIGQKIGHEIGHENGTKISHKKSDMRSDKTLDMKIGGQKIGQKIGQEIGYENQTRNRIKNRTKDWT